MLAEARKKQQEVAESSRLRMPSNKNSSRRRSGAMRASADCGNQASEYIGEREVCWVCDGNWQS